MKAYVQSILLSLFLTFSMSFTVAADEVTDVVNDVASKLLKQLPLDKKIALKSRSPEETGLPEEFLRQLLNDVETAFFINSDFQMQILNRTNTELVWEETIEFGNKDFDDIYGAAKAEVLLLLDARASASGLQLGLSAYALEDEVNGELIASSGMVNIPMDLEAALGLNVQTISKDIATIISKIQKISADGGLISDPTEFSEYYHNATIYQSRGENDLAIANYRGALENNALFYDPLLEFLELLVAKYGDDGAEAYFENQLSNLLNSKQTKFSEVFFSNDVSTFFPRTLDYEEMTFLDRAKRRKLPQDEPYFLNFTPATHALFLRKYGNDLLSVLSEADSSRFKTMEDDISIFSKKSASYILMRSANEVLGAYKSGEIQRAFIDDVKASLLIRIDQVEYYLNSVRQAFYHPVKFDHVPGSSGFQLISGVLVKEANELKLVAELARAPEYESTPFGVCASGRNGDERKIMGNVSKGTDYFKRINLPIFADKCINQLLQRSLFGKPLLELKTSTEWNPPVGTINTGKNAGEGYVNSIVVSAFGISIWDEVDYGKPITLFIEHIPEGDGFAYYTVDITSDGTDFGYGTYAVRYPEDTEPLQVVYPKVFETPFIVQSSLFYDILEYKPFAVSYFDRHGVARKIPLVDHSEGYPLPYDSRGYRFEFGSFLTKAQATEFEKKSNVQIVPPKTDKPLTCGISSQAARVTNVDNYTNLRRAAGLNAPVVAQVPEGTAVSVVNPGTFLRYDRCAATCNGSNQNAIKACIDNNDVWIEVLYNGRRGFLSRKFLD
ncbi:hypothetical protein N9E97_02665 [Planktomarina sp.]|jgi:hypothetical protein|nr:hypothetical protein [Planktomarina sp.]